ncbi:PA0069 family radical SAM protein [Ramlibacter tataouinensis]|uniref:Candidate DNA repair photolyase n=1 Tax=Ramlibacter tataouinensis (strain ATCC BAA-407 / DSM 14655 / LMG 21543 / TTB310) TaxID=365046 RepID=F5Y2R3_RAMTT|nr:PA0069 family radical SAM protein [Ramlibacter tataouinensis]AEG93609.1 Candidate DNA repair photolyase [Ramlibacter tataouinensis TTB310]
MTEVHVPLEAVRGRGAATRLAHRFERDRRQAFDDGWGTLEAQDGGPPPTEVIWEDARSVLTTNDSPDVYFDRGINPYRGCEHGCIYCYARPTHSYLNLSPGLDFETRIIAKRNIAPVLRSELGRKAYRPEMVAIGTATDCYQPVERELRLTRAVIELMHETSHPFSLVTKSSGVERDLDLIVPMAQRRLAAVYVTITTLDPQLARRLEPRAAAPHRRLRILRTLAEHGVPCGVSLAPQIPFLNEDMEQVLEAAWEAGARSAFYHVLRLPWEVSPLFRQWLELHYPQRAARVMARIHDMRGGKDYDSDFASRMKGRGPWAELIGQRFRRAADRLGFNRERPGFDTTRFQPPALHGQGRLF